jgi:hypothetical protein
MNHIRTTSPRWRELLGDMLAWLTLASVPVDASYWYAGIELARAARRPR